MTDFVEPSCETGGAICHAWHAWFEACMEADPDCTREDRDPALITDYGFDRKMCDRPETCHMHAVACEGGKRGDTA